VTSKKFIKFLRKSMKEFGLNLKRKVCFKKSLKKKKKEKAYLPSLRPSLPAGPPKPFRSGPSPSSLFLFPADADIWAPPVSLSPPLPFFFLTPLPSRPGATARSPPRPATSLPSLLTKQAN
jgi:hypothetical protein